MTDITERVGNIFHNYPCPYCRGKAPLCWPCQGTGTIREKVGFAGFLRLADYLIENMPDSAFESEHHE